MFLTKTYRGRNNSRTPYESAAVRLLFDGSVLASGLAAALAALLHVFGLGGNLFATCHDWLLMVCPVGTNKKAPHRSSGWSLDIIRTTRALSISLSSKVNVLYRGFPVKYFFEKVYWRRILRVIPAHPNCLFSPIEVY